MKVEIASCPGVTVLIAVEIGVAAGFSPIAPHRTVQQMLKKHTRVTKSL